MADYNRSYNDEAPRNMQRDLTLAENEYCFL